MRGLVVMAAVVCAGVALGQGVTKPEPVGSVTGHVFCGDTLRPARLAKVSLVAVPKDTQPGSKDSKEEELFGLKPAGEPIETSLDGRFTLRNVRPGEYYVVVDMEGYLLPLSDFSARELQHPDEATKARLAQRLHRISVAPEQATNEEIRLERGASVSGTVTYDDGSPASGLGVSILTKGADGKWETGIGTRYRASFGFGNTDDFGHYRMTGLPPGEYVAEVDLALNEYTSTTGPMPGSPEKTMTTRMSNTRFELPIYSGNVWRRTTAVAFTLGAGEQRTNADLQFPLSKLHKVTGQVLARDGHAVNAGRMTLLNADDKTKVTETEVETADHQFHLEFVPEGDFQLKVGQARDVVQVQVANAPGYTPRFHEESRTVRTYGEAERELKVQGDASDLVMTVPDAGKPAK